MTRRLQNYVRGVRTPIPAGHLVGRPPGTGTGNAQLLPLATVLQSSAASGVIPGGGGISSAMLDAVFGNAEGSILQRGAVVWQVLTPGTNGDVLTTGGPGALNSWQPPATLPSIGAAELLANLTGGSAPPTGQTLTAILDAIMGNAEGSILQRGATDWQVLTPGTSGDVLTTGGSGALASWQAASGGVTFNNRGAWNGTAAYSAGDVVQYNGSAYVAYEPISAPSGSPPSLDGSIAGGFGNGASSAAVSLSTTNSNDYIIVLVYAGITNTSGISVSSMTGSGLTFTRRGGYNGTDPNNATHDVAVEEWYAIASGPLTSESITVTLNQACDSGLILAFGVANATAGFDPNVNLPAQGSGATLTLDTTDAYDFVFYYSTSGAGTNQYQGAPSGYTTIATQSNSAGFVNRGTATYYDTYTSTQSGVGIGGSGGSNYYNFMDALSHGAAVNPPPTTDDAHWLSQGITSSVGLTSGIIPVAEAGNLVKDSKLSDDDGVANGLVYNLSGAAYSNLVPISSGQVSFIPAAGDAGGLTIVSFASGGSALRQYNLGGGTLASPGAATTNGPLFNNAGIGWTGSAYARGGRILITPTNNWSGSANDAAFIIETTGIGLTGGSTPSAKFQDGWQCYAAGTAPTGGDKGGGTINVQSGYYTQGVLNGTQGFTVATLPVSPGTGARAYVTDATAPTFLGTLIGGGSVVSPVFYNGSAWVPG